MMMQSLAHAHCGRRLSLGLVGGLVWLAALSSSPLAVSAQEERPRGQALSRLEPSTLIPVRLNEAIDADRSDGRVYTGVLDRDVRGADGRVAIPRGSHAELIVRVARDNDLILDLESVDAYGERYAVRTDPNRVESRRDDSLVGSIVGAITGGEVRGRAVRLRSDALVTFRLERPLEVGVPDRGAMQDGRHYHPRDER